MTAQGVRTTQRPIPRLLARNAVWSEDLARVRLISSLLPVAIVTPLGEWKEGAAILPVFGKPTARQRKATAAWMRKIRKLMHAHPECLAARGASLTAFDGRCILADGVAPPSNMLNILSRRALSARRLVRLSATPDFHHGLLG
jgi:hypothetical protein